jgi:hypothetical protein
MRLDDVHVFVLQDRHHRRGRRVRIVDAEVFDLAGLDSGSLIAIPIDRVPRAGISRTAASGVISFDLYSTSYIA